jgi:hypothetical protein
VRGIVLGLILVFGLTLTILSLRPGGLRRQLRMAARRLRIVLVLAGIYVAASVIVRLAFPNGPVSDYGPPAVAIVLAVIFIYLGRDPALPQPDTSQPAR